MSLELLPDEILLEILRFLHPAEILLTFFGLNTRFNRTIADFIRHVRFNSMISYRNYLDLLEQILPSISVSIESLTISNRFVPCLTTLFLDYSQRIFPENLKKLAIFHLTINEIYNFLQRLADHRTIEQLVLHCDDFDFVQQQDLYGFKIAQFLFYRHPTLKSIELCGNLLFNLDHLSFLSLTTTEETNVSQ